MHQPTDPIRKSLLPCTPPPEFEFTTVFGARNEDSGVALFPGDTGPVVVRRRVTYGDWEPVRPDHWAEEPPSDAHAAATVAVSADGQRITLRDRIADVLAAADGWRWAPGFDRTSSPAYQRYLTLAADVMAVLPDPASMRAAAFPTVTPHTLTSIACHLDARAVAIMRPDSQTFAEWQTVVAELRRMAGGEQPTTETRAESCAHCAKAILRITGTLSAWWVHDPGGNTVCFAEQAASSPRATPKPAAVARQDKKA